MPTAVTTAKAFLASHPRLDGPARRVSGALTSSQALRTRRRKRMARSYFDDRLRMIDEWAPRHTEDDNFYYELMPRNRDYLANLVGLVSGTPVSLIDGYVKELADDRELRAHITSILGADPRLADLRVGFGRREGWYAFIRALKPGLVVETGVHHGVGACVITAALLRNADEGFPGRYVGTDIDPNAGVLLQGRYADSGHILYGDSITSLGELQGPVDVFINDSDHSADYEAREYEAVAGKLADASLVLGDNSHVTDKLARFARAHGRPFVFFREEPRDHWYPGAGIGISPSAVPLLAPERPDERV